MEEKNENKTNQIITINKDKKKTEKKINQVKKEEIQKIIKKIIQEEIKQIENE
jgi:hypothetical protein